MNAIPTLKHAGGNVRLGECEIREENVRQSAEDGDPKHTGKVVRKMETVSSFGDPDVNPVGNL